VEDKELLDEHTEARRQLDQLDPSREQVLRYLDDTRRFYEELMRRNSPTA
jgi:hypothetical protein